MFNAKMGRWTFMDKKNIANLPREARLTETVSIGIAGMTCDSCVRRVERALRAMPGVHQVAVDRTGALAKVTFDSSLVDVPAMHDALLKSGYRPVPLPVG
jgi:Cu+-exporting ATPase